jgi:hypothetical protein
MTQANGLQEVFDRFLDDFSRPHPLSPDQERACRHIERRIITGCSPCPMSSMSG